MQIQKSQMSKQFKALYPNEDAFNVKVWSEVQRLGARFNSTVGDVPEYLDDRKTFYNGSILYEFFYNKYETFWSVNSEERVHKLFVNALLQTLPALYLKTRSLTPEALAMLSPQKLLENLERRYNENPDTNYASTETAYSSTPSSSQGSGTWKLDNSKEKNITLRKDATIRVRELSNVLKKMDELNNTDISGYIYEFINSIEFSSLWTLEQNANIQVVEGIGIDFSGALNGQVLAYDKVKNSYKWVNPDGSNTSIGGGVPWLTDNYSDLTDFENNAQNYEVVKYNLNKDGSNNSEGILLLVKVGSEVKEFRTWEEINAFYTHNSDKLISNDTTVSDTAEIGRGYKGNSTYSFGSVGNTWFGGGSASNTTVVHVGSNNAGTTSIGENTDKVLIGTGAKSNLQIGAGATGEVDIHFSENGVADKVIIQQNPADNNKLWVYIDGAPAISLRNIADIENRLALKADRTNVNQNTVDIAQLASEIQVIENTWTGDRLMPSNGTSDLSSLQGDKGAFDFTAGKKLIITVGVAGHAITETETLKVGAQGSYHLVGEGIDATFGVTVSDSGVVTIQNFASTGSTSIVMHGLIIKEIEQNPKAVAVIDAYTKAESDGKYALKTALGAKLDTTTFQTAYQGIQTAMDANLKSVNDALDLKANNDLTTVSNADLATAIGRADVSYTKAESDGKYATSTYVDTHFMLKTEVIETVEPTVSVDGTGNFLLLNAGTVVGDHTLGTMVDGEKVDVNFKHTDALGTSPADGTQIFIGSSLPIRILNSSGSAALKWGTKTNPTDVNVKDNFQSHNFRLEKQGSQFNFVKLIDAATVVDKTYVDNAVGAKQDKLSPNQLANINADHSRYLTSHQDISGKVNANLGNTNIPIVYAGKIPRVNTHGTFTYVDLPATVNKAEILTLLGVTDAQLGKLITLSGKTLVLTTYTFDDDTTETHWGLK